MLTKCESGENFQKGLSKQSIFFVGHIDDVTHLSYIVSLRWTLKNYNSLCFLIKYPKTTQ